MLISVQTKRVAITPRKRQAIKAYVRRLFERQRWDISRCVVSIEPEVGSDDTRLTCDIRLWSAKLGLVVVRDTGETIRTVVQRAATRAREVVRRRLHKRRARARRRIGRNRIARWLAPASVEKLL